MWRERIGAALVGEAERQTNEREDQALRGMPRGADDIIDGTDEQ